MSIPRYVFEGVATFCSVTVSGAPGTYVEGNASDQPLGLGNTLLPSTLPMVAAFTEHTGDPDEFADAAL